MTHPTTYRVEAIYLDRNGTRRSTTIYRPYMPVLASDVVEGIILDARIVRLEIGGILTRQATVRDWQTRRNRDEFVRLTTEYSSEGAVL